MIRVITCITHQHDYRVVLLAALVCAIACGTTTLMLSRAAVSTGTTRMAWIAGAALAFGSGVWTTHFVAMLAFEAGVPVSYAPGLTAFSLGIAIVVSFLGLAVLMAAPGTLTLIAGTAVVAGAVAAMHYLGMAALQVLGSVRYDASYVIASVAVGMAFTLAAFTALRGGLRWVASFLLAPAICGLHFTAMAAVSILPATGQGTVGLQLPPALLAIAVAAVGLLVLLLSLAATIADQRSSDWREQERVRLRQFADATFEGIVFARNGIITDVNHAICQLADRTTAELVGQPVEVLFTTLVGSSPTEETAELIEVELVTGCGERRPVELLQRPIAEQNGADTVFAVRDISERKTAERRIKQLAYYDPLTGLANRTLFTDRLAQALALAERARHGVALICLDLDRFKGVNDLFGHPGGDRVLVEASIRVREAIRDMDTAARLGGDEFAVIQQVASQREAVFVAERLLAALSRPYNVEGHQVTIGASIGIALFPGDGSDSTTLMKNADLALYRAKRDGRGMFRCFEPEMDAHMQERRAMEQDLREAIPRGELTLNYQPLVDSRTLETIGFEALLRWTHPIRGKIPPSEFIPLAEESGLIVLIGQWVLETACKEAASWAKPYRIAVNVSPAQFKEAGLTGRIRATLARYGLDPGRLELEITEGVLIEDSERALAVLQELKQAGVRIALDDFGTGYSSLSYLRRFPFDAIKIDQSFVQGIGENRESEAIVSSVIAMGRNLGLDVTAEGVETQAQLDILRAERCTQLQGFLLGRPSATAHDAGVQTNVQAAA